MDIDKDIRNTHQFTQCYDILTIISETKNIHFVIQVYTFGE